MIEVLTELGTQTASTPHSQMTIKYVPKKYVNYVDTRSSYLDGAEEIVFDLQEF